MIPNTPSPQAAVYSESGNYCSQLLRQGRGFPLYVPGPQTNLPAEYRRRGVAIGDVGTVTPEGIFDFFFNIYLPADHPVNANDVPENFDPLPRYASRDVIHDDFDPGDYVSPPSIHEINGDFSEPTPGGEFVFKCRGEDGAVLALPHGAHLEKLRSIASMRRYAAKHAESWYKYVNETRERELVNGSLYLITGCEKAQSWGMAIFHDVSFQNGFQLSFRPTADADNGYRYRCGRHSSQPDYLHSRIHDFSRRRNLGEASSRCSNWSANGPLIDQVGPWLCAVRIRRIFFFVVFQAVKLFYLMLLPFPRSSIHLKSSTNIFSARFRKRQL
ncbi:hypothetical protein B0H14DRAFT_1318695 [Mycena olivaceomarginata]|nr:hypothetical protein B0H14DRAFT_1318695 [Mycena olivaceomarginata]